MVRELPTGPSGALKAQHDLERWWRTPMARNFAESFDQSRADEIQKHKRDLGGTVESMIPEARMLRTCPTYSVTSDMLTLTEAAAAQFPGQPLYAEDLPSPTGFVLFDRSLEMLDIREKPVSMRAFSWQPVQVRRAEGGEEGPGVFLAMYSDLDDVVRYGYGEEISPDRKSIWDQAERVFSSGLALLHVHGILLGHAYDLGTVRVLQNHLAFIESLFALMQQRISVLHPHQVPRQIRRGIERDTGTLPDVRVVTLRRAREARSEDADEPGFVEWSHRWMVTGHWRRVWNEKRHQDRLVWVNPYIKGPDDKPLVVKDTVYRLSR